MHGRLSGELLEAIVAALPPEAEPDGDAETDGAAEGDGIFSVAIVGRPNVGKSTLFNRLVGEERSVVHDMPGTTRDAIDTIVETDDGPLRFVDTAGLRRKSRIEESTEYYGLVRALQAIDRADAALFLIDATEGVTHQDQRLAERVDAAGTAIVLVLNKWELLDTEDRAKVKREAQEKLGFLNYAPVLPISALTGRRVHHLLPALREAEAAYHKRIPTATLNRVLRERAGRASAAGGQEAPPAHPVRDAGRVRAADDHAVHDAAACRRPTCGTSSASCARRSTSARHRSSSACAAGRSRTRHGSG